MGKRKLTKELVGRQHEEFLCSKLSSAQFARSHGLCISGLYWRFKAYGFRQRRRGKSLTRTKAEVRRLHPDYLNYVGTTKEFCEVRGIRRATLYCNFKRCGLTKRKVVLKYTTEAAVRELYKEYMDWPGLLKDFMKVKAVSKLRMYRLFDKHGFFVRRAYRKEPYISPVQVDKMHRKYMKRKELVEEFAAQHGITVGRLRYLFWRNGCEGKRNPGPIPGRRKDDLGTRPDKVV